MSDLSAPAGRDDVNSGLIAVVGFVSAIVTFALIIGIQVLYYHVSQAENERKVIRVSDVESDSMLAQQEAKLARYDNDKGRVTIPIERAMELVVREAQPGFRSNQEKEQ
jgi:hypothetical protein